MKRDFIPEKQIPRNTSENVLHSSYPSPSFYETLIITPFLCSMSSAHQDKVERF